MTPDEIIETYGLTDENINRALRHAQPETVAAYADALDAFTRDMSAANFTACQAVERRILQEGARKETCSDLARTIAGREAGSLPISR